VILAREVSPRGFDLGRRGAATHAEDCSRISLGGHRCEFRTPSEPRREEHRARLNDAIGSGVRTDRPRPKRRHLTA
jgi:hypothetical protein